jgi:hypothetical protein
MGGHHHLFWTSLVLVVAIAAALGILNLARRKRRKDNGRVKNLPPDQE